jgi:ferredoxin
MEIGVDPEVCEANGVCARIAPAVFTLDDEDVLHIHRSDPSPSELERVTVAVASCPKNALFIRQ